MEDSKAAIPVVKARARLISLEEMSAVSGAGTVIQLPGDVTTDENTYDSKGRKVGQDQIVSS